MSGFADSLNMSSPCLWTLRKGSYPATRSASSKPTNKILSTPIQVARLLSGYASCGRLRDSCSCSYWVGCWYWHRDPWWRRLSTPYSNWSGAAIKVFGISAFYPESATVQVRDSTVAATPQSVLQRESQSLHSGFVTLPLRNSRRSSFIRGPFHISVRV